MTAPQPNPFLLPLDSAAATLEIAGGKGASLARLVSAGLPVPPGFHITTHAYRRYVTENHIADAILSAAGQADASDPSTLDRAAAEIQPLFAQGAVPADIALDIRQWYGEQGGGELGASDAAVAVRSSATAEDLPGMSFAGLQETYLNVRGADHVLDAVKRCWGSLWTARAIGYRVRHGIPADEVALAVVVQQLVPADVAGILFTANPLTGARDEMTISAAWGLGEAIVGGLVTPDTFTVNRETGAIASQHIACKEVMTVRLQEGTREEPVPEGKRMQAALTPRQIAELARLATQIEQLYGQPMDIEWAIHEERLFILQARPITALPEALATLDWTVPRSGGKYARSSVIELLPDPLSPLFATFALPLWNGALRRLMDSVGAGAFMLAFPDDRYVLMTINGYAYYDLGFSARESAGILVKWFQAMPAFARMLSRSHARWADEARPRYQSVVREWTTRDLRATPAAQLLDGARAIVKIAADYYLTVQSGILPVAYMSEVLFTKVYGLFGRRETDPPALTFLLGFDSAPIQAEKSLYDLAAWANTQPALAAYLTRASSEQIAAAWRPGTEPVYVVDGWREFCRRLSAHLERFGHAVYDLDFAKPLAGDDPAPLFAALKYFLAGEARNPHERQATAAAAREQATQALLVRCGGLRRRMFRWLLGAAQRYAPLREDALMDIGLGWPLVRNMFREAGRRIAAAGAILEPDDVFWLNSSEVEAEARALDAATPSGKYATAVAERRAAWEREQRVTPPTTLPLGKGFRFLGINFSSMLPARTGQATGDTILGIGASPGRVAGAAKVIRGPAEFNQMRAGDILVAKITTPAWTPLFALAAGVVTDVGGPLSHSSIVAREYHIPAVLGTGVGTERIHSGLHITVDGDRGAVHIGKP